MMPEMDGFQSSNKINEDLNLEEIPYIFLTAQTDPEVIVKCFEMGVRDYIGIEEGKNKLVMQDLDLLVMLNKSLFFLKHLWKEKNIEIKIHFNQPVINKGEPISLINSVLNNVFTNAIKFSYSGDKIDVNCRQEGNKIILLIRDYGIGIPPEIVKDLFSIEKPTTRQGTNEETGTGFGMPLLKKLMEAFEGEVEVKSKDIESFPDNHGTTLSLIFPKP